MAKFQITKDKKGEFRWQFLADNGLELANGGEGYKQIDGCNNGIRVVKEWAGKEEVYQDAKKEWRWRFKAKNNQIVAVSSESYKAEGDCKHGLGLVKAGAAAAQVEDKSGGK